MIAIPNMSKPKSCSKCRWWDTCSVLYDYFDGSVYEYSYEDILDSELDEKCHSDCPLIEIDLVRCGECKHLEVINKAPIYAHCHKWGYDFELWQEDTRKSFCSHGERRVE